MTVGQLFKILELAIKDGHESAPIYFDTDARTFEYHMAKIGSAYLVTALDPDEPFIWLGEE